VCVVSGEPRLAAEAIARDVVAFDQRGCLSARILWVDGSVRAAAFARALAAALEGSPVARGALTVDERGEARRWMESIRFAGELWDGPSFAVGLMASPAPCLPPPGRHVHIALFDSAADLRAAIAELAPFVTTIGVDAASEGAVDASLVPHARVVPLGTMQRPPLDGPVDRRGLSPGTRSLPVPRGLVD
jgi:hypothetical protein